MLKHRSDFQTLLYMLITTALPVWQWNVAHFNSLLFLFSFVMAFAVGAMHHNHAHVAIWRKPILNSLTDFWFTIFQGHPGFIFGPAHIENHHRYRNREQDFNRTYRRADSNNFFGFLIHPLESVVVVVPVGAAFLRNLWQERRSQLYLILFHYCALFSVIVIALVLDWRKAVLYVIVPQVAALFFLLASNYLQHAHTDEESDNDHSRNFIGLLNPLFFNVGYHTAHHADGAMHWSRLPQAHAAMASKISPQLIEKSFCWYCLRVFLLSLFIPRMRSSSLRQSLN